MHPPHQFPSLIASPPLSKPVLLIGAGMSSGIAPMPFQLARELEPNQKKLEADMGCGDSIQTIIDPQKVPSLYVWAEEVIVYLQSNGKSLDEAKKILADAIGISSDPRWRGKTKIPLRGSTPRHRVIARLAREGRWHALWSLNWDCVLEKALESVGMPAHPGGVQKRKLPWVEWHRAWTQPEAIPLMDDESTLLVVKPHGCAGKLAIGQCNTFKVTANELKDPGMNQEAHKSMLTKQFSQQPLIACGWSASEGYLLEFFKQLSAESGIPAAVLDKLTIIDPYPAQEGHLQVTNYYKVSPVSDAQFQVEKDFGCTADELFLWVQVLYGLNLFKQLSGAHIDKLSVLDQLMEFPVCNHWINGWFDNFLPVWVRLCFNAGVIKFHLDFQPSLHTEAVPTDRRDEHIPWHAQDESHLRPDLQMASSLLIKLSEYADVNWNTDRFPGALWDQDQRRLILPLPCLTQHQHVNLTALRSMTESHHWERKGEIMSLDILPLNIDGAVTPSSGYVEGLKLSVSKLMKHTHLADLAQTSNIRVIDFSALKGDV